MKIFSYILIALFTGTYVFAQDTISFSEEAARKELDHAFDLSQQNKLSEAILLTNKILKLAKSGNYPKLEGRALITLGVIHSSFETDKDKALDYYKKAEDFHIEHGLDDQLLVVYNNIGVHLRDLEEYDKSTQSFYKVLDILEKKPELGGLKNRIAYNIMYNLGYNFSFYSPQDYQKALDYLFKSIELSVNSTNKRLMADIYEALGYTYWKLKDFEKAHFYYDKCIEYGKANEYLAPVELAHEHKSKAYIDQKKYKEANEQLLEQMTIADSIKKLEQFDYVKKLQTEYEVKENTEKITLIEREKELQEEVIKNARQSNIILIALIILLLIISYLLVNRTKQYKKQRDKAEELSKVKSVFYSEISHELRTPLYAVIKLSHLLLKENKNPDHKEYLESLNFSGNHLLTLINNVLELNKIESTKLNTQQIEFNLKELITNITDSLSYAIRDSNNKIKFKCDENIPKVIVGDSLKLSQILINLIANAIKFTSNGKIKIEVKLISNYHNKVELYFGISDNGVGISKENQKHIFDEYYQEETKRDKSYKGSGLGLYIVKKMLNLMDSDVFIESEINKGTKFYFKLDFSKKIEDSSVNLEFKKQLKSLKSCKFLIVDDNKINQLVTSKILNQFKLKCDVVSSGKEAVEATRNKKYDCILMDLHMPEMDGYQATERIRKFDKKVTIVALTAASREEIVSKIYGCDMDSYISKPFYEESFIKIIAESIVLRKRNGNSKIRLVS
ncbi:response regulator [Pontimicrobium sp. SW4]|uniref:histidine kinase n=1 Tax=Pontimicrobium sp. SW4 TaxID=3153519 RepID=A0AAU7BPS3_9FLAO